MQQNFLPRIVPLLPSDWDATILDALGAFPSSLGFVMSGWTAGPDGDVRGMHVLGVLARHPALAKAFLTFNAHVSGTNSTLARRIRELVILRISWLRYSEYEFAQHIILGRRAGLTDAEIERIQIGPDAIEWAPEDADLLRAVDELHVGASIQDATWERLSRYFDTPQLMDLVFVIGCYGILSWAFNTFGVQLERTAAPLDSETRARMLASQVRCS
jgi:alkylhydroperoxidase family enzyme